MSRKQKKNKKKAKPSKSGLSIENEFQKAHEFHSKGDIGQAENLYRNVLRKDPGHPDALHLLGVICLERNECDQALSLIQKAIRNYPKAAPYYNNLGITYQKKGLVDEAVQAFRKALEINPDYPEAHNNLGTLLKDKIQLTEASSCFERATRINTGFSTAYYNLGTVLCDQARIPAAIVAYKKALDINPALFHAYSNLLYTYHFADVLSPQEVFEEHKSWARSVSGGELWRGVWGEYDKDSKRRLRIGYVSPDFYTHSVAFFLEDVLASHNRKNVEIYCYSNTPKTDDFTIRFKELADHWREIQNVTDREAADIIMNDRVDILVDLAGHTRNNRLLVFALKPAPIQVTWLGYPDTTGLTTMDYRLTDTIADPGPEADNYHSERLYRMPHGFLCYRPSGEFFPVSQLPYLSSGAITFGSFNNNSKISPKVIEAWAAILNKVPGSRMKLKSLSFSDFGTRKFILEGFQTHGIPSDRIWFEGYRVSLKEHFLLYNTIDIALDTFPYNGTTTTCESLWMGVPVIALSGDRHSARVGNSILTHLDIEELIAESLDDYVNIAVELANDHERLETYRKELRDRMIDSPLLDSAGFTTDLEEAYRFMWSSLLEKETVHASVSESNERVPESVYERNIQAIRTHHPHVERLLNEPSPFDFDIRISPQGIPNLCIKDSSGGEKLIYPEDNPLSELPALKQTVEHIKGKVIGMMGAGLFIHARAMVEWAGQSNLIVFFESEPAIFNAALKSHDLSDVLTHPRVRLAIGGHVDPYELITGEQDKPFTQDQGEFIEYNRAVALNPSWYERHKRVFDQFLKRQKITIDTAAHAGRRFLENSFNNLLSLSESVPINDLKDLYKDIPAVLVAAGPSLSRNIHELVHVKDKALIIAVDSALSPLMAAGVKPHMVVSVDYNAFTYEKFAPFDDDVHDVDFVYIPLVTGKIVNGINFKSKIYSFPDKNSLNLFNRLLSRKGHALEDIHSVIHLALATAQIGGCDPIIFTGLDLAFSGSQDHVGGTILHWGNNQPQESSAILVEDIHGNKIPTTPGFIGIMDICERMIRSVPQRTYIDASEGGAKIAGSLVLTLSDAMAGIDDRLGDLPNIPPVSQGAGFVLMELNRLSKDIEQTLNGLNRYFEVLKTIEPYIESNRGKRLAPDKLPEKIKKSIGTLDKINTHLENDPTVLYSKSILVELYEAYRTLEMEIYDKGASPGQRMKAVLNQQIFVQNSRKKALLVLMEMIDGARELFELITVESTQSGDGKKGELIQSLIDRHYLVKARSLTLSLDNHNLKEYYLGCINIIRGNIGEGKEHFRRCVCENDKLNSRISAFNEKMIDMWVSVVECPLSYNHICLDYALTLDPQNEKASEKKQQSLLTSVMPLIDSGCYETAFEILENNIPAVIHGEPLLSASYSILLLGNGLIDKSLDYMKYSVDKESDSPQRTAFFQKHFQSITGVDIKNPVHPWLTGLIATAENHFWAKRALQEIFWLNISSFPSKILAGQFSKIYLAEAADILMNWEEIREFIPEWLFYNAYIALASHNYDEAESSLLKCMSVETSVRSIRSLEGRTRYTLILFNFYQNRFEKGKKLTEDLFDSLEGIEYIYKLLLSFVFIRSGNIQRAINIIDQIFQAVDSPPPFIKEMKKLYSEGLLIPEFEKYNSLTYYAAFNLILAGLFEKSGDKHNCIKYLRGVVNFDMNVLSTEDGPRIYNILMEEWEKDCRRIETYFLQGEITEAEILLEEWEATRDMLKDYNEIKALIVEQKEGRKIAPAYVKSCMPGKGDDSRLQIDYARKLFDEGQRDEAWDMVEKGAALNSELALVWEYMGDVWLTEKNYDMAIAVYEKCLMAMPERMDVLCKIGDVYRALGMVDAAILAYGTVIERDGTNDVARTRLKELKD